VTGDRSLVVVGAGVFGASVARHCALAGWDVVLVERIAPGHVRSGSGDESRLIRCCHGTDAWHTRSARRAWALWHDIDPGLVVPCGVAWMARRDDGWEAGSEEVLRAEGIPTERVDARELFPSVTVDDLSFTLFEPEAGILHARRAVGVLTAQAMQAGAELVLDEARPEGASVLLGGGRRLEADRVVWACGAWLGPLFPQLLQVRITHQDVFYFGATAAWRTPGVPGWVDYDASAYGLGDLDGRGVKTAPDIEGPECDPDAMQRVAVPAHERAAREYLAHRFPALAGAPLVGHRACQYEITADTQFVIAPHPEHDGRVWLMGGGSGHGFKHGPALAERMERWLTGDEPPEPRLALGERTRDVNLRTAGLIADL
jgi:glycine/D-amino acid oxidase-like deaminating enzyme